MFDDYGYDAIYLMVLIVYFPHTHYLCSCLVFLNVCCINPTNRYSAVKHQKMDK